MAPGRTASRIASPASVTPLPHVSFRRVEDESEVNEPAGVTDPTSRSYGYNDFSFFTRPDYYIRYIEPIESELTNQVEYDMDEQDQEWLDLVNEDRRKGQVGPVSSEIFEIMMDRLEKEWFELMKRVPKPDIGLPSEDSTCAVCDDGEGENSNAIVFCDGCNLAVHQDCYGVPYIPEGQWLCRKCTVSPEIPVPCVFCPNEGGAFKQTSTGLWAHLLCAMFIPEVTVGNTMFMEPIDNVDKVPKSRWKLTCSLCKIKHGACVQCDKTTCFTAFHVTCARRAKLLMGMKGLTGEEASFKGYCEKHLPEDVKKTRGEIGNIFDGPLMVPAGNPKSSKSARAYSKKYSLGPPLVPQLIADKLENYYKKHFRQKTHFVQLVCKYWSLKREARRGAPLLKRLHLEPWTASTTTKQQTEQEKAIKLQYLINLRKDLEKVRILTEFTRKREQQKLLQAQLLQDVVSKILFPYIPALRRALEQIRLQDKNEIFYRPVTRTEAPDYFDIVKNPMSFMGIEAKLDKGEYIDFISFKSDINLVFDNAMLYNKRDTVFHKTAARLKTSAAHILSTLSTLTIPGDIVSDIPTTTGSVGDLETDPEILKLLFSEESIKHDSELTIDTEPITSLFRFERARLKPPPLLPPPPPPQPPKKRGRPKRDYKMERERRKQVQAAIAAENAMLLDASPGFRAPRATRSTRAALAALEAELVAGSTQSLPMDVTNGEVKVDSTVQSQDATFDGSKTADVAVQPERPISHQRPRSWRREHVMLPGQGGPNMVDSMDNQGSFKHFDRGWILPSGSRRHGRAVPEAQSVREPGPPPRKRSRTDADKLHPPIVNMDPVGNKAIEHTIPSEANLKLAGAALDFPNDSMVDSMEVDQPDPGPSEHFQQSNPLHDHPDSLTSMRVTRSSGEAARSSGMRTASLSVSVSASEPATQGGKRKRSQSVANELGELEIETGSSRAADGQQPVFKRSHKKGQNFQSLHTGPKPKALGPKQGMITLQEGESLLGGTLVWAKMESYPWWAAVVWEEDPKDVPMNVLRSKRTIPRTEPGPLTLVQFYDKARSWQWLELSSLRLLGEDQELDSLLLSGRGKIQTFRTPRLRQGCRHAYKQAIAEMEGPEVDTNDETTNPSIEASASVEPLYNHQTQGTLAPVPSLPSVEPTHQPQPSFQPPIMPTSQSSTSILQLSPDRDMIKEQPVDQSFKLESHDPAESGACNFHTAIGGHEAQTNLSSELSDLDSEV